MIQKPRLQAGFISNRADADGPAAEDFFRRSEQAERRDQHIDGLERQATESDLRLMKLYDSVEAGVADLEGPALKQQIVGVKVSIFRALYGFGAKDAASRIYALNKTIYFAKGLRSFEMKRAS